MRTDRGKQSKDTRIVHASCTAVSWIPSEAMDGLMKLPIDVGIAHYDPIPPERLDDIETYVSEGRCRFANHIEAWAEIRTGRIINAGFEGRGLVADTRMTVGLASAAIPAVGFPEIQLTETDGDRAVTFVQTAGGRTGAPFPRRRPGRGLPTFTAPTAWTTIALTIEGDGSVGFRPRGASRFPRHWFYGPDGTLAAKSATIDYRGWTAGDHDAHTPWGDATVAIEIAAAETALERTLSTIIMQGEHPPRVREVEPGEIIMAQGDEATTVMLILDGMVDVEVDGRPVAECGPGSLLGERSGLEGGRRTSTVKARTRVKLVEAVAETLGRQERRDLSIGHRAEG